jgi:hypothetical protein
MCMQERVHRISTIKKYRVVVILMIPIALVTMLTFFALRIVNPASQDTHTISSASFSHGEMWIRSDECDPPCNMPIIGVWVEHGLDVEAAIEWDGRWHEYALTLRPPVGGLLYSSPPTWWIGMPGVAK